MIFFESLTQAELAELLLPLGQSRSGADASAPQKKARYRAQQIYHWVYQRLVTDWDQMTDLSVALREWLKQHVSFYPLGVRQSHLALDGTQKFLWSLADDKTVESVIIPAALNPDREPDAKMDETRRAKNPAKRSSAQSWTSMGLPVAPQTSLREWGRLTACISSQVGCAMACKFCLTGIQGLDRHLHAHEIVAQVFALRKLAPITNIVFMGMGEPLHNLTGVTQACRILLDTDGLNFSKRKVTLSTSGLVPAIESLGQMDLGVSLAVSLNATTDEQRSQIMPVNRKWNIQSLLRACQSYPLGTHRRITFEYVMIAGLNDSLADAERLPRLLHRIPSKVNLIPFNPHPGAPFRRPSDETVRAFQASLLRAGLTATVRISRGQDILAACGQLRSVFGSARGTHRHADFAQRSEISSQPRSV